MSEIIVEMKNVTKRFGSVVANANVNFDVRKGEILSVLGENGSGKTTLMNMLAGIYFPDEGQIFVNGEEVVIKSPIDAFKYKIGMIHQHFKLVDLFTACDNIILGEKFEFDFKGEADKIKNETNDDAKSKFLAGLKYIALPFRAFGAYVKFDYLKRNRAKKLQEVVDKYGFNLDLSRKVYDLSVSEKQTVEIIKVLYRGADILILDEPTAVLTPQEIEKLFDVLRKGEHIATVNTSETNEQQLTEMMVGQKVELEINRTLPHDTKKRISVENLTCKNREGMYALQNVSFDLYSGEILGVAGIAGSGQKEMLESIAGLVKLENGDIRYFDPKQNEQEVDLRSKTPVQIRELGVRLSFVPEDRLGMGLVGSMNLVDNMMLRSYRKGHSMFVDRHAPKDLAETIVHDLEVATPSVKTPVRRLSGGNVQKVLVGREIAASPTVLMAAYPVRGLDINSSYMIYNLLNEQKEKGVAVVFVGEDLDVLLALSDRILVMCGGKVSGVVNARKASKEQIGMLMTKMPDEVEIFDNYNDNKEESEND